MGEVNSGEYVFLGAIDGRPIDLRNRTKNQKTLFMVCTLYSPLRASPWKGRAASV